MNVIALKFALAGIAVAISAGCATTPTFEPVPREFTGPTAQISDTSVTESSSKVQIFALLEVDGNPVKNGIDASRQASFGKGSLLDVRTISRLVPIRLMKVKIIGTHQTGAPIHEIASRSAGTFFTAAGVVEFAPEQYGIYVVKGDLQKTGSSVWIEEVSTKKRVTEVVRN